MYVCLWNMDSERRCKTKVAFIREKILRKIIGYVKETTGQGELKQVKKYTK